MCLNQIDRDCSHCDNTILDASIVELFAIDQRIIGLSQVITVIAQEQVVKIQLQCHFAMERSNQSKVWKHFTRDDNSDRASCIHCSEQISFNDGSTSGFFVI